MTFSSPETMCLFVHVLPLLTLYFLVSLRPPDEHSGSGGGSDGALGCGGGSSGESASQGEGRVSLLLRHPQKQQGVQPHIGGGAQGTG